MHRRTSREPICWSMADIPQCNVWIGPEENKCDARDSIWGSSAISGWSRRAHEPAIGTHFGPFTAYVLALSGFAAASVAMSKFGWGKTAESSLQRPLSPQDFKQALAGPILSLPTTFNEDLSVNHDAIRLMIGRALRYGVPIFELTAGNSKYACLEFDEIKAVTKSMVDAVGGNGLTIAATGAWLTDQVIDYADFSRARAPMRCKSCCQKTSRRRTSSTITFSRSAGAPLCQSCSTGSIRQRCSPVCLASIRSSP